MRKSLISLLFVGVAFIVAGCSSSSNATHASSSSVTTSTAPPASTRSTKAGAENRSSAATVWLCQPGHRPDPCITNPAITQITADGTRTVAHPTVPSDPGIDCFYVYPTVSTQNRAVANLDIDPAEIDVAKAQASLFSQTCRVFAPMYRQRTISGLFSKKATTAESAYAYADVDAAWEDYLAHDNHGRGVILIGHSQGSFVLTKLIQKEIDPKPAVRKLLVSAMLLGGNLTVPDGKTVGGSFQHIPECTSDTETGCLIAYSTFPSAPVANALFGKSGPRTHVVCTNPAALGGGSATLHPAFVTGSSLLGSITAPSDVKTHWVGYPGLLTGECKSNATHTWLEVTENRTANDNRPQLTMSLGPTWGFHLVDVNVAIGDLVDLARSQAAAWRP